MSGRTEYTAQTLAVFAALLAGDWRHGYDLAKQTGLKSGTLYPILVRLSERGVVDARWESEQPAGRPRRHLYRLSAGGAVLARTALEQAAQRVAAPARLKLSTEST